MIKGRDMRDYGNFIFFDPLATWTLSLSFEKIPINGACHIMPRGIESSNFATRGLKDSTLNIYIDR